jgi:hypothetical protein
MKAPLRSAWEGWKRFAFWLGEQQAIVVYFVLYWICIAPIAIVRRLIADPFQYRRRSAPTFWVARPPRPSTLEEAARQ